MAKKIIQVHYHPAMKEIKFKTLDGQPFEPEQLKYWQRDSFVLQEHGKDFFKSISEAFDGAKDGIEILFFGTQIDYNDFQDMVKYYNLNSNENECKFTCKKSGVLTSMEDMYSETETFGEAAVLKLKHQLAELENAGETNSIKDDFKKKLKFYIESIESKINSLKSTGINICFVGTYSAGKSSLINAIIGERILPEDDESKTAKFYIINQPVSNENECIIFELDEIETFVIWNDDDNRLELDNNKGSHDFRKKIEDCIENNKNEPKHKQFYKLLDLLNGSDVGIKIRIKYYIPINTSTMSFTIYDTPGTGSNTMKHKDVLEEAVGEQSHSIVVFVGGVTKLEGEGNSLILQMLNGENRNSIDLDRSLYVINRSDTTTKSKIVKYQEETIRLKDSDDVAAAEDKEKVESKISISLKDKKLFFVSAAQACAAKAMKANVADEDDYEYWEERKSYPFYSFNRYGNSEEMTERITAAAKRASGAAEDEYERAYIDVGLFSLVEAIQEYGGKYAVATKVNALISTVEEIFDELKKAAQIQNEMCSAKIEELEKDLNVIKGRISTSIDKEYNGHIPKKKEGRWVLDEKEKKEIGVDRQTINNVISDLIKRVFEELQEMQNKNAVSIAAWFDDKFGTNYAEKAAQKTLGRNIYDKILDDDKIVTAINSGLNKNIQWFNQLQKKVIEEKQKAFKNSVITVIAHDSDLTDAAKKYLIQGLESDKFDTAEVSDFSVDVKQRIGKCVTQKGKWIFAKDVINIGELIDNLKELLEDVLNKNTQDFINNFCENLSNVVDKVKINFDEKAEEYSVRVQDIKNEEGQVSEIADRTKMTANELEYSIEKLEALIWKESTHHERII